MYCYKCGTKVNEGAKFCYSCGQKLDISPQNDSAPEMTAPAAPESEVYESAVYEPIIPETPESAVYEPVIPEASEPEVSESAASEEISDEAVCDCFSTTSAQPAADTADEDIYHTPETNSIDFFGNIDQKFKDSTTYEEKLDMLDNAHPLPEDKPAKTGFGAALIVILIALLAAAGLILLQNILIANLF